MDLINFVSKLLSLLCLLSNISIPFVLFFLFSKKNRVHKLISKYSLHLALVFALVATLGSLFYSEIAHYEPCRLCWYQRIFMYPLVILLLVAVLKKDFKISLYLLPMSIIGGIIAVYQYIIQVASIPSVCSINSVESCTTKFFFDFGYITIPWMAFSAFFLISCFMIYALMVKPGMMK